jgi:DNA-binding HxlR family transcriptional regulator
LQSDGDGSVTRSSEAGLDACSIANTLDVIGDRWTLLILRDAFRGIRRFDEFHHDLGVARNLLAVRLTRLVEHGVLAKVQYQEHPPRFEYRLTAKGRELSPALVALMHWGDRHAAGPEGPQVELVHRACDHPVEVALVCWHCDTTVTPAALRGRHQASEVVAC